MLGRGGKLWEKLEAFSETLGGPLTNTVFGDVFMFGLSIMFN